MPRKPTAAECVAGKFTKSWRGYVKGDEAQLTQGRADQLAAANIFAIAGAAKAEKPAAAAKAEKPSRWTAKAKSTPKSPAK